MLADTMGRPLRNLRISVTDRCNMRCRYCMPEAEYVWLPRESILTFEEIDRLVGIFAGLGVRKVRLTGGEPLLRHDLSTLVGLLGRHEALGDLAMTTNGILLARSAEALRGAGNTGWFHPNSLGQRAPASVLAAPSPRAGRWVTVGSTN